jgi:hypothetical protein
VVTVIDVGEVAQLGRRQLVLDGQEPHPAGSGTPPGEALGQERSITAADRPDQHRRSVTQPRLAAARRGPGPVPVTQPHHPRRPSGARELHDHLHSAWPACGATPPTGLPEYTLPGSAGAMLMRRWNGGACQASPRGPRRGTVILVASLAFPAGDSSAPPSTKPRPEIEARRALWVQSGDRSGFRPHPCRRVRRRSGHRPDRPGPVLRRIRLGGRQDHPTGHVLPGKPPGRTAYELSESVPCRRS